MLCRSSPASIRSCRRSSACRGRADWCPSCGGRIVFGTGLPEPGGRPGAGGFLPSLAHLAVLRGHPAGLVPYGGRPVWGGTAAWGSFATRSPFRPNHLGLSSVRLERVEQSEALGPVLHVCGADLMDGTPIFDIKPLSPLYRQPSRRRGGLHRWAGEPLLRVECPPQLLERIPADSREGLLVCWRGIPAPGIRRDPQRVYGMGFAGRTCNSPWRGIPSRCAPSTRWRSNANIKSTRTPMKL